MSLIDKGALIDARVEAHTTFQRKVYAAAKTLANKLSRLYDKEFSLEAKETARVPRKIVADVPADKIETVREILKLDAGDGTRPKRRYVKSGRYSKKTRSPAAYAKRGQYSKKTRTPSQAAARLMRAVHPNGIKRYDTAEVEVPAQAVLVLRAAVNPTKPGVRRWTYAQIGVLVGADSKFVWRIVADKTLAGEQREPQRYCSVGERKRLEAAADIVSLYDPPTDKLPERTKIKSPALHAVLKKLHDHPDRKALVHAMAARSGRSEAGLHKAINSAVAKPTAGFGRSVLWQFVYDRDLCEVIHADPELTKMLVVPSWVIGTPRA